MKWKQISFVCLLCCGLVLADVVWLRLNAFCPFNLMTHWGFLWPVQASCSEVYHQSSSPSIYNDGPRCHVFSYENEGPVASLFDWSAPDPDVYKFVPFRVHVDQLLDLIDVPEEWHPDYENCLLWQRTRTDSHDLFVFWDKAGRLLYFVEYYP